MNQKNFRSRFGIRFNRASRKYSTPYCIRHLEATGQIKPPPVVHDQLPGLYPHQAEAMGNLKPRQIFAWEMQTGKTLLGVNIAHNLSLLQKKTLVVTRKPLIRVWIDEAQKFAPHLRVCDARVNRDPDVADYDVFVVNYENFYKTQILSVAGHCHCLILDESQATKSPTTKTTKTVQKIADDCEYVYCLSGTPAPNGEHEWYTQLRIVSYKYAEYPAYSRWLERNFNVDYFRRPVSFLPGREDFFRSELAENVSFVKMRDVNHNMPESFEIFRYFEPSKKQISLYKNILEHSAAHIGDQIDAYPFLLTQRQKLKQVVSGFLYRTDENEEPVSVSDSKINLLSETLQAELTDTPVVIWYEYQYEKTQIENLLKNLDIQYAVGIGAQVQDAVELFNSGAVQVLISNPNSLAHGVRLRERCDHQIFYSFNDSFELYNQARARITGPDKDRPNHYWHFMADPSTFSHWFIDRVVYQNLLKKGRINDVTFEYFKKYKEGK